MRFDGLLALATLVLLGVGMLLPEAASAQPAPEVVLVVDSSESMQYLVGRDDVPDCKDPSPPRTRWNFVLELLLGQQPNYKCTEESLADNSDMVLPPGQSFGDPTCIGGVPQVLATSHALAVDSWEAQPIGDRSWAGGAPTPSSELRLRTDDSDVRLPYFSLDTKNVPDADPWVTGSIRIYTKDPTGALPLDRWVYLVQAPFPPSQQTAKDWVCSANSSARAIVSEPAKVNPAVGGATTFKLTSTALDALRSAKQGGKTRVHFAIVPVDNWMKGDCSGRDGKLGTKFNVTFYGPAAGGKAPAYSIGSGKVCAREGPGKHFAPKGPRDADGFLDTFAGLAKFGLLAPDNLMSNSVGSAGGFSYAGAINSYWDQINIGAANPFIPVAPSARVTPSDDLASRNLTRQKIKSALESLRPVGGTPIGRQLEDLMEYFGPGAYQDPHFQSLTDDPVNGDPYFECRERMAIVFSDGGGNMDDGTSDGRQKAVISAAALFGRGVKVYVVAVGHDGKGDPKAPPQADLDLLDAIALAGGTGAALRPTSTSEFIATFKQIFGASQISGQVGTRTVFSEATGDPLDVQHTVLSKSFFNAAEPIATRGLIEQRLQSCAKSCVDATNPSQAAVCTVLDYEARLKTRSLARTFYTHVTGTRYRFEDTSMSSDTMQIPTAGQTPRLKLDPQGNCVTEPNAFDLSDSTQREQYRKELIALVRSENGTCREGKPLGAIVSAQPAFLDPADQIPLSDPVFKLYLATKTPTSFGFSAGNPTGSYQRPTMVFAATHDGQLHAFRTDRTKTITVKNSLSAGDEMWSWIPGFSLRRLRELKLVSTPESSLLGGNVVATHALLERKISATAEAAREWRAVVLVGAGEAGTGYAALDVTAPDDPQLMW
ncbi:MAG: hypothetical protein RIT45_3249, partial [Pseudomonadota bacterium]